ncbi:DUF6098 family protein [Streptomyces sp. NPDC051452]|uniref:DUF6098 family protein n=1 Tax=Streptomyces sp. NPDC051452 TaxID=3365654 RepID=UPI0037A49EFD
MMRRSAQALPSSVFQLVSHSGTPTSSSWASALLVLPGRSQLRIRLCAFRAGTRRSTSVAGSRSRGLSPGRRPPPPGTREHLGRRRLYGYCHLPRLKDPRTRPWLLRGRETARGPDNEPLVTAVEPLGWISDRVTTEACDIITEQPGQWGTVARAGTPR